MKLLTVFCFNSLTITIIFIHFFYWKENIWYSLSTIPVPVNFNCNRKLYAQKKNAIKLSNIIVYVMCLLLEKPCLFSVLVQLMLVIAMSTINSVDHNLCVWALTGLMQFTGIWWGRDQAAIVARNVGQICWQTSGVAIATVWCHIKWAN